METVILKQDLNGDIIPAIYGMHFSIEMSRKFMPYLTHGSFDLIQKSLDVQIIFLDTECMLEI